MTNKNNTIRFIYDGSMLVLNNAMRFAQSRYFVRRKLQLNSNFIVFNGVCYYQIPPVSIPLSERENVMAA